MGFLQVHIPTFLADVYIYYLKFKKKMAWMTCWLIPLTIVMVLYGFIQEHFGEHIKTFFSRTLSPYC